MYIHPSIIAAINSEPVSDDDRNATEDISRVLRITYGVGILGASTEAVEWARDRLVPFIGWDAAQLQVQNLNAIRDRLGKPLAYVD